MSHILDESFCLKVAKGEIPGHSVMSKFGQNDSLTTDYQDVWDNGGDYTYPDDGVADITHIFSTDAGDTTQTIEVQGLTSDGTLLIQNVALNGTTGVELAILGTPLWRVFRLKNITASVNGEVEDDELAGDVILTDGLIGGTRYAKMAQGNNQTLMALYTIPLGYTGYLLYGTNSLAGTSRGYAVSGRLTMRQYGMVFQLKKTFGLHSDGTSFVHMEHKLPAKIPAKTDIRVSAISSTGSGVINTTFDILLVEDGF